MRPILPSPNRTCGFPAYGSPRNSRRKAFTGRCAPTPPVQRLAADLAYWHSLCCREKTVTGIRRIPVAEFALKRRFSHRQIRITLGSLRSTGITPLHHYYEPLRLPTNVGPPKFPAHPSARVVPLHPGQPPVCLRSLLPQRLQASPLSEG